MRGRQFWPFSKCSPFSNIRCFFERFFAHNNSNVVANFGHFQNALIFPILGVFWSFFLHTTTLNWSYNRFSHLLGIFNFWPKLTMSQRLQPLPRGQLWPFSKCSPFSNIRCFFERFFAHNNSNVVANFGHFQNALIFPILGVFWSAFLHTANIMWSYNRFSHLLGIFNFLPKLTLLQRL